MGIDIFIDKKDIGRWAKDDAHAIMSNEAYFRVLLKENEFVKHLYGYNHKLNLINQIYIFKNINNQYIAQVVSYRKNNYNEHKLTNDEHCQEVCVSTYLNLSNKIILLNHFDPIGKSHANNYSIYPAELQPIYENYFTDYTTLDNDKTYYVSKCPHFHFNTAHQTENLGGQEHANAISIKGLIRYLKDLNHCNQKNSILLKESFGMPFLTYHKYENKYKYVSVYENLLIKLIDYHSERTSKNHKKITKILQDSYEYYKSKNPKNNTENIILDLKILDRIIKDFTDDNELIAIFSNALIRSINNKITSKDFNNEI